MADFDLYDDHILDHYECPYHKGPFENASCRHQLRNPLCGDEVELQLKIDEGRVTEAWFDGEGCAISQAAASLLCSEIEGRTVHDLREFDAPAMLELIKVPLTASRQRCGLLCFRALKTLVYAEDSAEPSVDNPVPSPESD